MLKCNGALNEWWDNFYLDTLQAIYNPYVCISMKNVSVLTQVIICLYENSSEMIVIWNPNIMPQLVLYQKQNKQVLWLTSSKFCRN